MTQQDIITRDRDVLGGTAVFAATRVPVRTLLDYLEAGQTIDEFLEDFPTVTRDQVVAVLENSISYFNWPDSIAPRAL